MDNILSQFNFGAPVVSCEPLGKGHINKTYVVRTGSGGKFVLQRINSYVFRDVEGLMANAVAVSEHIRRKCSDPDGSLKFIPTRDNSYYLIDSEGQFWRSYRYIDNCLCLQLPESTEDFYRSGIAFGTFQAQLEDFPAESLCVTIPDFHNTPERIRAFRRAVRDDRAGRAANVMPEIDFILARESFAACLTDKLAAGELPLRVTHNDTKLNNVLLDERTRKPKCIIDLDTVMPGLSAYDYGDAIRFGACTALEDERELSRVHLDMDMLRAFTRGFVEGFPALNRAEKAALPNGAKMLCYETGARFLTDYLDGDVYFAVSRPEHNLHRARVQLKMVAEIEERWSELLKTVEEVTGETLY